LRSIAQLEWRTEICSLYGGNVGIGSNYGGDGGVRNRHDAIVGDLHSLGAGAVVLRRDEVLLITCIPIVIPVADVDNLLDDDDHSVLILVLILVVVLPVLVLLLILLLVRLVVLLDLDHKVGLVFDLVSFYGDRLLLSLGNLDDLFVIVVLVSTPASISAS